MCMHPLRARPGPGPEQLTYIFMIRLNRQGDGGTIFVEEWLVLINIDWEWLILMKVMFFWKVSSLEVKDIGVTMLVMMIICNDKHKSLII